MSALTSESTKVDPSSPNPESEYDTASDSPSDEDDQLYDDDELDEGEIIDDSDDDLEDEEDDGSVVLDLERQRGDGQEQDGENKKKVDTAEDRSNPQYIPKKGTFYEHDDRTADDGTKIESKENEEEKSEKETSPAPSTTKAGKKWQSATAVERWSHDRFDESEQAPKSRSELVSAYGYDIRNEDGPPRARRRRRYGRGPNKYTRKWEDEGAYSKPVPQRKPRPEDFPALGSRSAKRNPDESFKENNSDELNKRYSKTYSESSRSPTEKQSHSRKDRSDRGERNTPRERHDRGGGDDRRSNYSRSGRNTLEFKNQNRNRSNIENSNKEINNSRNQDIRNYSNHNQPPSPPMETMSFTNTKLSRNDKGFEAFNRSPRDRDIKPSNISGRIQNVPPPQNMQPQSSLQQQQQQHQPQQQQISSNPRHQNILINQNIPNLNQIQNNSHSQSSPQLQQSSQIQQTHSHLQNMPSMPSQIISSQSIIAESSRPKRYSSLRQKSTNESLPQQSTSQAHTTIVQSNSSPQLQHEHLLQLSEKNLMQLTNEKMNKYAQAQQKIHDVKSQGQQNMIGQITLQPQALPQTSGTSGQGGPYAGTFFAQAPGTEYPPQQVQPVPQGTVVSQNAPNSQIISGTQFSGQYPQTPNASYIQAPPGSYIQQPTTHQQPHIINIVPTQTQYPAPPQYVGYPNYPATINQPKAPSSGIYQTQGGLTFFAPQTQTQPRPILPQRRPTNAIPIVAPQERGGKGRGRPINIQYEDADESQEGNSLAPPLGSAENIDHILDNMFVQRAPYQPPTRQSSPPLSLTEPVAGTVGNSKIDDHVAADNTSGDISEIEKNIMDLNIKDTATASLSMDNPEGGDPGTAQIKQEISQEQQAA